MGHPLRFRLALGENFIRLLQIASRTDLREASLDFHQPGHDRKNVARDLQRAAIGKNLCVEPVSAGSLFMAGSGSSIRGHRFNQPIGDVKLAAIPAPQVIMRQFVTDNGFNFFRVE